ncbi:MAG: nucleoside phosphorylase [Sporolactobacillus sp.]
METLYMKLREQDIAANVILSGDPWRVEILKKYLKNPKKIGFHREFNTYTGLYKDVPVTITSTGIGAPSAAIAMEELYQSGMKVSVRMGTIMTLDKNMLGDFIIPTACVRNERTSTTYVDKAYPAVANFNLVDSLNHAVAEAQAHYHNGVICSMDGFYSMMHESKLGKELDFDYYRTFEKLKKNRILGVDMESSCILTLGQLMGIQTSVLTLATVSSNLQQQMSVDNRTAAEDLLCRIALEGIYIHDRRLQDDASNEIGRK